MINVTKTYLPDFERYMSLVKEAYDAVWITNNGKLVQRLEKDLKDFLGAKHLYFCSNGTITLQIAIKAMKLQGEIITTPFSYVATTNTIIWENCTPVFVDIDPSSFCIDPALIESRISPQTSAILATHVYGNACDIEAIDVIAKKYGLKVIYDAAHAFGVDYKGKSLLSFGDVSSCSFHATKIFHTVEGGCLVTNDDEIAREIYLMRQFGHVYDEYFSVGINGKNSEMHAAMGLAVLPDLSMIIERRKEICQLYDSMLKDQPVQLIEYGKDVSPNYAYYPVIFKNEETLLKVKGALESRQIFPRRYFFPSLNKLSFLDYQPCPVSESIASRALCLPLFFDLDPITVNEICSIVISQL